MPTPHPTSPPPSVLVWRQLERSEGFGFETISGIYRARYETCHPNRFTVYRIRHWRVWVIGLDHTERFIASGYCYHSENAVAMIERALELEL